MKRIEAVNDFVVKFANVNGSGSASANELFAKAILRMGVPVSPRNIFPSNIQGLPTWYEVRVSEKGYLGRRGGIDMMVAMNPQTWDADVAEIEPGGYLFYDSTRPLPPSKFRDDITVIGMPLTEICNATYSDPRQRLKAPALNLAQALYVSGGLKTGRVMVKDEDVCLHCGLCAERCPTGAWDMQKFLLKTTQAGPACRPAAPAARKAEVVA